MISDIETDVLTDHAWQKELRVVILGWDWLENSLVGNAILGDVAFDTESNTKVCVGKQVISTAETRLTVVNTPPNWLDYVVSDPASVENRLVKNASLCQPGPHIFLMVIPVDSLPWRERSLEATIPLLSDTVWQLTIVVFTGLENLTETMTIVDLAKEYGCLESILDKCGHRNHYLIHPESPQGSVPQAPELLRNMMELAAWNQYQFGEAFVSIDKISEESERRTEQAGKRAHVRKLKAQKECQTQKLLQTANPSGRATLRVVMVGAREAGKSTAGNVIFGQDIFQSGHPTVLSVEREGDAAGRHIVLVDTPGWEHRRHISPRTPEDTRPHYSQSTSLDAAEPNGFLLVVRCDETFTETDKHLLQEHLALWGQDVWRRGIVLFTHGDQLGQTTVEQHIEKWPALVWLVEKCGNRYHVLDNMVRTCNCKVKELVDKMETMDLMNDSQCLLQAFLRAEVDKFKQRSKVKELQKKVRDLQRDYEQQERLQEEREQRLQELFQSCGEKENLLKEKEKWINERVLEFVEQKKEHQIQIENLIQRCSEQDKTIKLMKKEQMTLRQILFDQEPTNESEDCKQLHGHGDQNRIENLYSDKASLLQAKDPKFIPSECLQLDRPSEIKSVSLRELDGSPQKRQTHRQGTDSIGGNENSSSNEPPLDYVELDSAALVVQEVEQPTQEITTTKQHPQLDTQPLGSTKRFEGAAVGALIGSLAGLHRGALRAVVGTAIGASVGALLDAFLWAKGKP